jgi:hypothetical protein
MYSGYEVGRDWYLRNRCDGSPIDRRAASGPTNNGDSTHVEFLAAPDAPGLLALEGPLETLLPVATSRTNGLGALNVDPLLGKEQVTQGAVAVGATLGRDDQWLLDTGCSAEFEIER